MIFIYVREITLPGVSCVESLLSLSSVYTQTHTHTHTHTHTFYFLHNQRGHFSHTNLENTTFDLCDVGEGGGKKGALFRVEDAADTAVKVPVKWSRTVPHVCKDVALTHL